MFGHLQQQPGGGLLTAGGITAGELPQRECLTHAKECFPLPFILFMLLLLQGAIRSRRVEASVQRTTDGKQRQACMVAAIPCNVGTSYHVSRSTPRKRIDTSNHTRTLRQYDRRRTHDRKLNHCRRN